MAYTVRGSKRENPMRMVEEQLGLETARELLAVLAKALSGIVNFPISPRIFTATVSKQSLA